MPKSVLPRVYFLGCTQVDGEGLEAYLRDTGNEGFLDDYAEALSQGLNPAEALCSFYGKLCYNSLSPNKNANLTGVRDVAGNLRGILSSAHMSVLEHVQLNFVVRDCSRIFTHEACRHRVGTAFSQTSGRYCRIDELAFVLDPLLEGDWGLISQHLRHTENLVYQLECRHGLREPPFGLSPYELSPGSGDLAEWLFRAEVLWRNRQAIALTDPDLSGWLNTLSTDGQHWGDYTLIDRLRLWTAARWVPSYKLPQMERKKLTSAIRSVVPNGQANELGISLNLRALRHTIMMRTSRHAEWQIRLVFGEIYKLVRARFPLIFSDAKEETVDELLEVTGMRMQPYESSES